ncbi:MAG: alkaline phosphatase family protein [Blastocatellia bacterium]
MRTLFNLQRKFLVLISVCLLVAVGCAQDRIRDLRPTVILLSIDGMRFDYLDRFRPDNLQRIADRGVRAKWLIPSFPTKTFPNHYSIATGLYPEHHGIIENNIRDFGTTFSLNKRGEVQNPRWWLGEPIWVTAEKQGLRAASFFFPGTETAIKGKRPSFWREYDGTIPNFERVDQILKWLDLPVTERPQMITLYFSDVDDAGHAFSPDSKEVADAVKRVDEAIGRLAEGLRARGILDKVNLIIVSDHGMATVYRRNAVIMDEYFNRDDAEAILATSEIWQIFPRPGRMDKILSQLKEIRNARCWSKSEIPARLHYRVSPRIAPIVCSADEGWLLVSREQFENYRARTDFDSPRGAHGYDNANESMRAIFIAAGPGFRKGYLAEPFKNIEIYNLMCKILRLRPAANDGNLKHVRNLLH